MRILPKIVLGASLAALVPVVVIQACGTDEPTSTFKPAEPDSGPVVEPDSKIFFETDSQVPCDAGLRCNQKTSCGDAGDGGDAGSTSLSGTVYDPTGTVPLYNAVVYVPNAAVDPFKAGVTCDTCGTRPSGEPIAAALTDAKGQFTIKNVPVGVEFPLVIQVGRWRRQIKIPAVTACVDTPVPAVSTRLPRDKKEGELPQIALTTGGSDALECFLRNLGISDSEFTNPSSTGAVHLYQGLNSNPASNGNGSKIDNATPAATALWNNLEELKKHDIVILSCEGDENNATKTLAAHQALRDYMNLGGRVFASHYHRTWINTDQAVVPQTATWLNNDSASTGAIRVDQSFAKGQALADWLLNIGASTTLGQIQMNGYRHSVKSVFPGSRAWIYEPAAGDAGPPGTTTQYYSFNTPVEAGVDKQCGRTVFTDIHVSLGDNTKLFPTNCPKLPDGGSPALTPQEKALLFLIMDLASCIQDDSKAPEPPPVIK